MTDQTSERLIPEDQLYDALADSYDVEDGPPLWWQAHPEGDLLDIAELRLLLGLDPTMDNASADLFLRIVRRLVAVERQVAELPDRIRAASELDDTEQEHLVIVGDSGQVDIRHPRYEALGLADPEPCALAGFLVRHREAGGVLQPGPFRVRPVGPAAGAWTWEPLP